ncbi:MAG: alpha/beta hydrolase [Cyclobacteriaceae bacterium]|nr:alpha/beta hydrolase [Cyclobacteriaceae bacterium]
MNKVIIRIIGFYLNSLALIAPKAAGKKGFELFCWPRRIKMKPHQLEFLNQSDEKFTIDYAGKKVQGYRWGKGKKKILLLHGWQSHSYWWRYVINRLTKEEFTIFSLDAPGHGLSEGDFLNLPHYSGLIEQFIAEQKSLHAILTHSFGGFATVYSLHKLPHLQVSKLVVMAAPGEVKYFFEYYQNMLQLSQKSIRVITEHFIETIGHPPSYFQMKDFAKTLAQSGLIIHDTEDKEAPYKNAIAMSEVWKNSKLITTTGLGHNLKSKELVEEVAKFV